MILWLAEPEESFTFNRHDLPFFIRFFLVGFRRMEVGAFLTVTCTRESDVPSDIVMDVVPTFFAVIFPLPDTDSSVESLLAYVWLSPFKR